MSAVRALGWPWPTASYRYASAGSSIGLDAHQRGSFALLARHHALYLHPLTRWQTGVAARDDEQTDRPRIRSTMSDGVPEQGKLLGGEGVAPHHHATGVHSPSTCRVAAAE